MEFLLGRSIAWLNDGMSDVAMNGCLLLLPGVYAPIVQCLQYAMLPQSVRLFLRIFLRLYLVILVPLEDHLWDATLLLCLGLWVIVH